MIDCLKDYIGIKICGDETPGSGIFINSLPGITLESMDKISTADQETYAGLWRDVQEEASSQLFIDFIGKLSECHSLQVYCDYTAIICVNKAKLAKAWQYLLGATLMTFRLYSTRLNRFTTIDLGRAKELRQEYEEQYDRALSLAAKVADVSACSLCCDGGNPQVVTWMP